MCSNLATDLGQRRRRGEAKRDTAQEKDDWNVIETTLLSALSRDFMITLSHASKAHIFLILVANLKAKSLQAWVHHYQHWGLHVLEASQVLSSSVVFIL